MLLIKSFPLVTNQSSVDIWELAHQTLTLLILSSSLPFFLLLTSLFPFFLPHLLPPPSVYLLPPLSLYLSLPPSPSISFVQPLAGFFFSSEQIERKKNVPAVKVQDVCSNSLITDTKVKCSFFFGVLFLNCRVLASSCSRC